MLKRMEKVLPMLRKEVEVARLQKELSAEVNRKIGEHQREFFLKEQLKVIQQELGLTKDDRSAVSADPAAPDRRLRAPGHPHLR